MVIELGLFALIVSCLLAAAQAFFGLAGAHFGNRRWMAAARPAVAGQWVFIALSFAVLSWAFYKNDFSVGKVWVDNSGEFVEWLADTYEKYSGVPSTVTIGVENGGEGRAGGTRGSTGLP